ncbi:MAG: cysteine hydrolase [Kiloniellales bacterium]|nr:cysteine hydrolase [Kiloniellales bacterium]
MQSGQLSREVPITPGATALLVIDIQNYFCRPDGGGYTGLAPAEVERDCGYFFRQLSEVTLPAIRRLQEACRAQAIEVIFTVIESLTRDGRDRSLDYKISGFNVPRGSRDAQVLEEIAPAADEIVLPKTSSSVFISTNLDYLLRNLGVRHLMIVGCLTDQCVESAVRDACDLGYLVTLVTDGCASMSPERHDNSLRTIKGYCRQRDSGRLIAEIAAQHA